jgi:hypothetical protein
VVRTAFLGKRHPAMFPGLVASGALAAKISFWNSLVAIWLVESILPQRSQKKAE